MRRNPIAHFDSMPVPVHETRGTDHGEIKIMLGKTQVDAYRDHPCRERKMLADIERAEGFLEHGLDAGLGQYWWRVRVGSAAALAARRFFSRDAAPKKFNWGRAG